MYERQHPTQERIKYLFDYKDGHLYWSVDRGAGAKKGDKVNCKHNAGYISVGIDRARYLAHRIIWIYHNGNIPPNIEIDHINKIRDDNRIENLRLVTHQEQQFNAEGRGYYWSKKADKWRAKIKINRKEVYLGVFDKEEEARQAYLEAKQKHHRI